MSEPREYKGLLPDRAPTKEPDDYHGRLCDIELWIRTYIEQNRKLAAELRKDRR